MLITRSPKPLVIWRLLDGRAGHENQVLGLSEALDRLYPCCFIDIRISPDLRGWRAMLPGRFKFCRELPKPDFMIAAGHGTHWPLLRLKRQFGGQSVVIMRPSLPSRFFDVCVVPAHDQLNRCQGVIVTEGALNRIRPAQVRRRDCGVFLIGGPSKHFDWSDSRVIWQMGEIVSRSRLPWIVMTSQRTPESFHRLLRESGLHLRIRSATALSDSSPRDVLSNCQQAWVSSDSVSMIYEAITSGCDVGLLELSFTRSGRLSRNIDRLCQRGLATQFTAWKGGQHLVSRSNFCESDRVAAILLESLDVAPRQGFAATQLSELRLQQPCDER